MGLSLHFNNNDSYSGGSGTLLSGGGGEPESRLGRVSGAKILSIGAGSGMIQDLIRTTLQRRGHHVECRTFGNNRWQDLGRFSLVIVEVEPANAESLAACAELRLVSRVPLLLLVSPTERAQGIRGLELGADGFLVLPFDRRELAARAEALMRRFQPTGLHS